MMLISHEVKITTNLEILDLNIDNIEYKVCFSDLYIFLYPRVQYANDTQSYMNRIIIHNKII